MWDSVLGKGFKAQKCKTLLRLAMARIKLLRNKREIQVKQLRKEIAQLLTTGQEPSARIRVEHIIREQNILAAYDILELFCELVAVRLPIIEAQKNCPLDLKEAISSLIFASPRCSDLPELLQIRQLFAAKYGKDFAAAAAELRPDCGVNRRIIEKLSVRAPPGEVKLKLMKEIAAEHDVKWDSTDSEAELLKTPEDLLDGPNHFVAAHELPLPPSGISDSTVSGVDTANFPTITMSEMPSQLDLSSSDSLDEDDREQHTSSKIIPPPMKYEPPSPLAPPAGKVETVDGTSSKGSHVAKYDSSSGMKPDIKEGTDAVPSEEGYTAYLDVASAAKAAAESANRAVAAARAAAELARKQSDLDSSRLSNKVRRQDSSVAAENESSDTELDSDDEDSGNILARGDSLQGRHARDTNSAPAPSYDSDSDEEEYDVPRGRGAGGTKMRPVAASGHREAPGLFGEQKQPLKATKLDFQSADASGKPVFDSFDDDYAGENPVFASKQELKNRSYGGDSTSGDKGGGLRWYSREERDSYDIFDANRDKTELRYSAFESSDNSGNHNVDHDVSKREETYSPFNQPFAESSFKSKLGPQTREGSPLFDEEGSVGRSREPSRFGSIPRTSGYDDDQYDSSPFSNTAKFGLDEYTSAAKSSKTIEEDDLNARFEALKTRR